MATLLASAAHAQEDCSKAGDFGLGLVEHSCFHTTNGPFEDVQADVGKEPSSNTAAVNKVHTHYRVSITPNVENVVTYTPNRSGSWVLFGDLNVPQRVIDAQGADLRPLFEREVEACEGLGLARVFLLEARETYAVVLGPTNSTETIVELENVSDFDTLYGFDADGDSFGGREDTVLTPCRPPDGFVAGAADCEDDNPAIHPGATETCDEVDRNCNGAPADGFGVGKECSLGEGACAATASFQCAEDGDSSWCPADEPGEPSEERCNGVDDDCDGVSDEEEDDLCADDENGKICILGEEDDSRCGCSDNADCESGSFCQRDSQRCIPESEDSCACRVAGAPSRTPATALLLLAVALFSARRRTKK